jgi:hypothetical protein
MVIEIASHPCMGDCTSATRVEQYPHSDRSRLNSPTPKTILLPAKLARTLSAEWFVGADGYRRGHGDEAGKPEEEQGRPAAVPGHTRDPATGNETRLADIR